MRNRRETRPPPVSCAAEAARKRGASDRHAVMAAGLAGGIGLSGGACGARGAAVWITGLNILKDGAAKFGFDDPRTFEVIRRFLKCTGDEFECRNITGRRLANTGDRADSLRCEGCSELMAALAAH